VGFLDTARGLGSDAEEVRRHPSPLVVNRSSRSAAIDGRHIGHNSLPTGRQTPRDLVLLAPNNQIRALCRAALSDSEASRPDRVTSPRLLVTIATANSLHPKHAKRFAFDPPYATRGANVASSGRRKREPLVHKPRCVLYVPQ
jgi:hypothetical protein